MGVRYLCRIFRKPVLNFLGTARATETMGKAGRNKRMCKERSTYIRSLPLSNISVEEVDAQPAIASVQLARAS